MLNKYFDNIFCINLDRRVDRKADAEAEFKKFGIEVEFVSGIDGKTIDIPTIISRDSTIVSRGDLGCTLSHLKVARIAKAKGLRNYLVFEDDVELHNDFNTVFEEYFLQVPQDWQMLYFGGNHDKPITEINAHVSKMERTFTTHAFAAKSSIYDEMIKVLGAEDDKVDICISSLHSQFPCYVFRPHLAFQRAGFSDILEKHDDYQHLRK